MASTGIYWFGANNSKFQLEYVPSLVGSPLNWRLVPELKAFSRNPAATDQIPFTHYLSTRKERRAGLPDDGTWDAVCNFLPLDDEQEELIGFYASGTVIYWRASYARVNAASTQRANELFSGSIQTLAITTPGAEDTVPHNLEFTILGGGEYTYTKES